MPMDTLLLRYQRYLEPAVAIAFFTFWAFAEVGRHQILPGSLRTVLPWWAALLAVSVAIAIARIWPLVAMAVCTVVVLAQLIFPFSAGFSSTDWPIHLGLIIVVIGVSASVGDRWRVLSFAFAVGLAVACAGLAIAYSRLDHYWSFAGDGTGVGAAGGVATLVSNRILIFTIAILLGVGAWLLGFFGRAWQQKLRSDLLLAQTTDELRNAEVDLLVSQERDRIAQDVHDIMAHSLSVIIAQADGARFLAPARPEAVTTSLENIAASARTSLTEVRMLIETLVADPVGHSNPTIGQLDDLTDRMRTAGLDVVLEQFGEPAALTSTQELAVYRIVQESLTNALKHAGTDPVARVALDWRGQGLAVTVTSSGTPAALSEPLAKARGLYGMRERARLAGGWLTAGPDDDTPGGYVVTAYIPTDAATGAAA
jgi:signal transduction histidine kinase